MITAEELFYALALTSIENIGEQGYKILVSELGSAAAVFQTSKEKLKKINGLGEVRIKALTQKINEAAIQKEIDFIQKHKIQVHYYYDDDYPTKLRNINDAPILLFSKGNFDLHHPRQIAIVGTREYTDYGKQATERIIAELAPYDVQIISGMAYGIDIIAHKYCVAENINNIGVLAHGLDRIYPATHTKTALAMLDNGGLLTEYKSGTQPDKFNFPMRNRIVAGLADMTLVIESREKGGAMITAKLAAAYNREVGAIPGRIFDEKSSGCNYLIRSNIAQMIGSGQDIAQSLNWDKVAQQAAQAKLFLDLSEDEQKIIQLLKEKEGIHIDELMLKSTMSYSTLAATLLQLELQGLVRPMSGKRYRIS